MPPRDTIIGLCIGTTSVQAVEIDRTGGSQTLLALDEWPLTLFGPDAPADAADRLTGLLTAFLRSCEVGAEQLAVAVDSSRMFLATIPVDASLSGAPLQEHLQWEIAQYFPDVPAAEFIVDSHVLAERPDAAARDLLSVAVPRRYTRLLSRAARQAGLELSLVDVDHFSAETALRVNYPDTANKFLALVGVKEHRLDVSLIRGGSLESYSYHAVSSNGEIVDRIGGISRETEGIYSITVYGPHLEKFLLVDIRRESSMLVEALNPLRHVGVAPSLRLSESLSAPSYRFAAAIGAALRRD